MCLLCLAGNLRKLVPSGRGELNGGMKTIGVIGLGIIGEVWARHYAAAGVLEGAWNRTPQPDFPEWKASPEEVVLSADVVQIVVADPPAVRSIITRILPVLAAGKIVVQSSTIDPVSSEEFRLAVAQTGARYLEAPFTGSKPAAEQRQSVFYLGGDVELISALEPLLALISQVRFRIGDNKQAATLKLAMNLNVAAQMQALCEALTLVRRAGIADDIFFPALSKNVTHSGLVTLKESKLRVGDYAPQFSVKHMAKDMRLAKLAAGGTGMLPALDAVHACLEKAVAAGWSDEDFCALLKLL